MNKQRSGLGDSATPSLDDLLKLADPAIQQHVADLKTENAKLQRQIVKLETEKLSSQNRMLALVEEIQEQGAGAIAKLLDEISAHGLPLPVKP